MARAARGWSEELWDRVTSFLEEASQLGVTLDLDEGDELDAFEQKAVALRREMLAEETRRANG